MTDIRRYRWGYSFRAWIDKHGSNQDRLHAVACRAGRRCRHFRLWDFNRTGSAKNVLRIVRRSRPFYLAGWAGAKYRRLGRLGRRTP